MKSKLNFRRLLQLCTVTLAFNAPSSYGVTDTFNTAGTFNWVCPGGVTSIQVEAWGGGGAGGAGTKVTDTGTNTSQNGGGGGGGAYARRAAVPVTPGQTYTITIPAAAISVAATDTTSNTRGQTGGTVTFVGNSGVTVTAAGGQGGVSIWRNTNQTAGGGAGVGGTTGSSVGDVGAVFAGGAGSAGNTGATNVSGSGGGGAGNASAGGAGFTSTSSPYVGAGAGGTLGGGAGGVGRTGNPATSGNTNEGVGAPGATPGGGGGGAKNQGASSWLGGAGGLGQISLTYTVPPNFKADNTDNLDQTSSWTAFLPNAGNIAEWNNLVTGANTTSLGTDLSLAGIKISDPAGPVTISAGNILTLGAAATDLDLSTATQDLTLNCDLTMGAANVWNVASGRTLTLGGVVSGSAAMTKQGPGTTILSNANTYTGNTVVSDGTLNLTGTLTGTSASSTLAYGGSASKTIVNVSNDISQYLSITGANNAGSTAIYNQTAGTVTSSPAQFGNYVANNGGYGYFNLTGGIYRNTAGSLAITANTSTASTGVAYVSGNLDLSLSNGNMVLAYSASSRAALTIAPGGTLNYSGSVNTFFLTVSQNSYGVLNVAGGNVDFGTRPVRVGNAGTGQTGILNLDGGTFTLGQNFSTANTGTSNFHVNFAGGTLKAAANLTSPFTPTGTSISSSSTIFGPIDNFDALGNTSQNFTGGLTVDTNGNNVTFANPLSGATGNGVKQANISVTGGSGYTGAPMVTFTGGTLAPNGTPASGYALISGGAVTEIVITSPGTYTVDPSVTLTGGGGTGASVTLSALTANPTDSGLTKINDGILTLSGANTYVGATLISGGTLALSGTGDSNSSSGITVNGIDAKFNHASSVPVSPIVTVTQGTLTGSGTVNTVNVGAGTGGIISNNNGVAGAALTIGSLTFNGAATINTFGNAAAPIVTTTLASNAAGLVTINPSAATWAVGTPHELITYGGGSIGGAGFAQFQLGTVIGASPRQTKTLGNSGTAITLTVGADDVPYWVGDGDGKWNLASTNNWKLASDNSYTTFLAGDNALFNDLATGAGPIAVDIDVANVAPTSATFNNSTKNYTLGSSAGFGISAGSLTKSGSGTLTITNANSYTGNTVINGGVLDVSTDGAQLYSGANPVTASVTVSNGGVLVVRNFGQVNTVGAGSPSLGNLNNSGGQVVIDGGTLRFNNETSARGRVINVGANGATLDVVNNSTYTWSTSPGTSVPFTGSGQTLTLTGDATSTGTINLIIGGTDVSLLKTGAATWTLAGTNTYTGNTTISAGTLSMSLNRITTSPTIFIGNGATWNSTGGLTLAANQVVTGTGATGSVTTTSSTGLITTSGSTISTSGALSITRLSILGTDNQITGGNIQSGGSGTSQRGLLVGNGGTGVLTITGGTLTTNGTGTNLDVLGNTASAGDGTLVINGGNYVAAGAGTLNIGNASASGTLTITTGSATIPTLIYNAGTTGTKTSAIVNLDGGMLTLNNIVVTSGTTKEFNFNGGQVTAGGNFSAFSGLTMNVKNGGANINTNGFSLAISDPLLNSGTGGLVKSGLGTLTLSGVNTYTGGTSVTGGTLRFSTAAASATNVTVAGGAEAGALVAVDNGQWVNTADLTLQNNGAALVDYGSTVPSITIAPVSVTNFVNGTTPGVRLAGAAVPALTVGQTLPLITWSGTGPSDGSAFVLRTHRLFGTFSVASNTLSLTITKNAIGPIAWNTGNGTWDTVATNWLDEDLTATAYIDPLDAVTFGDAAGVSGNPVVALATTVSPISMTMNTTGRNYTVSGAGSIGGSGGLTLAATNLGTFTLATANNTFSGGALVNGGTLVLGDATNTLSDTGAVTVDGASAVLSLGVNSDTVGAVTLRNGASITGSGTLTGTSYAFESGSVSANLAGIADLAKTTTGTVTLAGANSYTGITTVNGGTLRLANTSALASTASIQLSSADITLQLATDSAFTTLPLLTGGSGFSHTIVSDRATSGAALNHQLGIMNFGSSTFNFIQGGNVASGTAGLTLASAIMTSGGAGTSVLNPIGATFAITGGVTSQSNNFARTLQLDGIGTSHSIGGVITQTVASALSVSKTNTSTWTLSGLSDIAANNYSGATTIDQGTLAFTTTNPALTGGLIFGATLGSTSVGTLDLSTVSATFGGALTVRTNTVTPNTVNVGSGQTLTVNGGMTMGYDAAGGTGASNSNLTLTGAGSLAVNGTTITVSVNQAATNAAYWSEATLDVTGLAAFSTNVTNFNIGVGGNTQGPGTVLLSNTANTIIATTLTAGNTGGNNGRGTGLLVLGTGTNAIQADTIFIGRSKSVPGGGSTGTVRFASQATGSPGTVSIANKLGTGRANIDIANQGATATGGGATGNLDLRGHVATVSAETVTIGSVTAASNTGGPTGTLSFDAGTFDVNTLTMGTKSGNSTGTARATLDIGGGTFTVNTAFTMGSQSGLGAANSTVNLTGGTLSSSSAITKGTGSVTSTINLNGGILDLNSNAIGSGSEVIILNAQSGTLRNLGELNGGGALIKSTTGTLILAGTNNYTGAATANAGILSITGTLNPLSSLAVGGGTVSFSGAAPQTVSGLTINAGSSTVTNTNAGTTNVLNVGAITRNAGGIVNFANATATNNVIQTSTANSNGILGTWAFVGSDFAMNDGSGNIVAYSGYTNVTRLTPGIIADGVTTNVRIVEGAGSPGNITLGAPITTVNSLLQSESGGTSAATIDTSAGTLSTDAIVMTTLAGSLTVGTAPNSGILTPATAGGDLVLTNNSAGNPLTINAGIADNTTASALIKAGAGTVILGGTNTYTGTTTVNGGTLRLAGSLASPSALVVNGTLQTAGNLAATTAVTLSGTSTLDLFGASQTVASLANVAGNTLTNSSTGTHASTATTPGSPALTDALTISAPGTANSLPLLVTDGPTRKTQVVLNNANGNAISFTLNNIANTFSGGVVLAHNATTGTRLLLNGTNNGSVGTGPVIIGQADTDKAGVFVSAATTFANDIVFNTALGTDRVGLRADAAITLSGKITANLAPATFTSNSATGGNITLTGQVTGASGLVLDITSLSAAATNFNVTLNNAGTPNNYAGDTVINLAAAVGKNAVLSIAAPEQIPDGAAAGNVVINSNGSGEGSLNLGGYSETINGLSGNGIVDGSSGTPTFTLGGNNASGSFSGVIRNTSGALSLVKTGTGTQALSGANTYTGTTAVSQGTLALVGGSHASPITVSAGASLSFAIGSPTTSTSSFNLTAGTIKITGTPSLASHTLITSSTGITGTPVLHAPVPGYELKVVGNSLVLEQAGYSSWAALNSAGANLNDDHDNDGVANGVEYFLGGPTGNTTGFTALPGVTNTGGTLTVTWVMGSGYAGVYGTDFTVETSDTLTGIWTTETSGVNVVVSGSNVTYTFPAPLGTKRFARLKVTGP